MSAARPRRPLVRRALSASLTTLAATACLATTGPPAAAAPVTTVFPDGDACVGFAVSLLDNGDSRRTTRTSTDREGDAVVLTTGAAESVVLTNLETGASVAVPSRGVRTRTTTDDGGTAAPGDDVVTYDVSGNLVLFLFASDLGGAGLTPSSTTLVAGRIVFTVDATGVYTVLSVTGTTTDLCAELAP